MTTDNAVILSDSANELERKVQLTSDSVLGEWAIALRERGLAEAFTQDRDGSRRKALSLVNHHCERYRNYNITSDAILDHAARGAARAKYLIRETLTRIKQEMRIPEILEY